jgi:hypothetical protein
MRREKALDLERGIRALRVAKGVLLAGVRGWARLRVTIHAQSML